MDLIPSEPAAEYLLCQTGDAFILLYAINNRKSFQYIKQLHAQISQARASSTLTKLPIFLVGSKADLESERKVSLEEARQLAIELRCQKLFEVSARDHVAEISDMFEKLVREIIRIERGAERAAIAQPPTSMASKPLEGDSQLSEASPRRSGVLERLKFGSIRRKPSSQSIMRKKSSSFGESIRSLASASPSRTDVRSVSYGLSNGASGRPSVTSSPFQLDVDTSAWRETVKWPTEIIPEEDMKAK